MKPTLTLTPTSLRRDLGLFGPLGEMPDLSPAERAERRRQFLSDLITPVPRPPRRRASWGEPEHVSPPTAAERAWTAMQAQRESGAALIRELLISDLTRPLLGDISPEQAALTFERMMAHLLSRHPELNLSPADLEAALEEAYVAGLEQLDVDAAPANLSLQKTRQDAAEGHGPTEEPHHD